MPCCIFYGAMVVYCHKENIGGVSMKTAKVVVLPYDTAWKSDFEKIKNEIESVVGDKLSQ